MTRSSANDKSSQMKYTNKLHTRRILIFGGSSGFGYAVAEACIEHAADLIISGSNPERLAKAVQRLQTTYKDHIRHPSQNKSALCALTDLDSLSSNLEILLSDVTSNGTEKIDHIVFTADNAYPVPAFKDTTVEDITGSLKLRIYASTILASLLARDPGTYLHNSISSSLTFTNGISGHRPVKAWPVPVMAATALEGLVRGLAVDLAPVRANLVSADPVKTDMLLKVLPEEYVKIDEEETLTKELGKVEDVAEAYLYIMKDGGIKGSILATDSGRRIA